jgi:TIR domain
VNAGRWDRMAYVPGLQHDLFLSYAHKDEAWVSALEEQLAERLQDRLGSECDIWQDKNRLMTGQNLPVGLDQAIRASAAFIAVLSRNYQGSKWCGKELETFLDEAAKSGGVETGGYGRVLKVIKFPWLKNAHEGFYSQYLDVSFFDRDSKTSQEREFKHTSEAFRKAVDKLSFHIEKLFDAMLRGREKVFVARAARDVTEEREGLIREIRAAGYAISPPPDGPIPKGLNSKTLRQYIEEARVTVHLLGGDFERDIREQIDLAIEAERKVVFCLTSGWKSATGEQRRLIYQIRKNKWNLPDGKWALLGNRSPTVLHEDLIALLAPPRPTGTPVNGDEARVYLLCDPTTPDDAGFAHEVGDAIWKQERIPVEVPQTATGTSSPGVRHERLLRECNGLLLYYEKAPPKWISRNVADLLTAEERIGRRELKSKAMLVGGSTIVYPGLTVIQRTEPFELSQLEPFLVPLRAAPPCQKGVAHAG